MKAPTALQIATASQRPAQGPTPKWTKIPAATYAPRPT